MTLLDVGIQVFQATAVQIAFLPVTNAFDLASISSRPVQRHQGGTSLLGLSPGPWAVAKDVWQRSGVRGLFRGLLVNVNTAVVWNICDQVVERYLPPHLPHYLPLNVVLLYVVLLPLAVLPINVLASDAFSSAGVWSSLRRLIDQSGGLWSMYTSSNILPALLGIAVRGLDQVCLQWLSLRINLARTAHPNALSGVIAWATSVLINAVSHPLWVMQNRLWLSPAALGPGIGSVVALRKQPYIGVLDCARSIIREEGWAALYRGFLETLILSVPGALFGAWQGRRIVARLEAESE